MASQLAEKFTIQIRVCLTGGKTLISGGRGVSALHKCLIISAGLAPEAPNTHFPAARFCSDCKANVGIGKKRQLNNCSSDSVKLSGDLDHPIAARHADSSYLMPTVGLFPF